MLGLLLAAIPAVYCPVVGAEDWPQKAFRPVAPVDPASPVVPERYLAPVALAVGHSGRTLYIAEHAAHEVAAFDISQQKVRETLSLPVAPTGLTTSAAPPALYISAGGPHGKIYVVDLRTGKGSLSLPVGHTPMSPVVNADASRLYVCNRFSNTISIIDLIAGEEVASIAVPREPVAAALTPDGRFLFVANHLPTGPANADYVSAVVSVIDTSDASLSATIKLPNGSSGLRGVCVSPDGKYAYVSHILARYQLPTTQLERGWMNTNALTVIDTARSERLNTVLLDGVDLGAANPWGTACSGDGRYLCVAHAGTHEVSVIEREKLHEMLVRVASGEKVSSVSRKAEDVPNDLSFLVGIRRRLRLLGNGPRGIALTGGVIYAAEHFSDSLGIIDAAPAARPVARSVALGPKRELSLARRGEMHFNDARFCFQQWQSCGSCHPDARVDALNWDLLNDGMGNPKNVRSMLLAHRTPPVMSLGARDKAELAVRSGIRYIQFAVRPEEDAVAIDEYLKSLRPVPSPQLVNGDLSPGARRGEKLFERSGCVSCHPPPLYTSLRQVDVGTSQGLDKGKPVDTPTLIEVWRTAPYLHDGRAATIEDAIITHNPMDTRGKTSTLSEQERKDLIKYILSL